MDLEEEEAVMAEETNKGTQGIQPNAIKSLPDMAMFVVDQLKTLPTQKYLDQKLGELRERTTIIESHTVDNKRAIENIDFRLRVAEAQGFPGLNSTRIDTERINDTRDDDFDKAARSIRFWPIEGHLQEAGFSLLQTFPHSFQAGLLELVFEVLWVFFRSWLGFLGGGRSAGPGPLPLPALLADTFV